MTRIEEAPDRPGVLTRLLLRAARRKTAQLTGRETPQMMEPMEAYAHSPGLLFGYGILELAAARLGLTDEQLLALPRHRESDLFDAREKLVLDYATAMSRTPVEVSEELFARLRTCFGQAQIVELTSAIALESMRSRFNAALDIGSAGFSEGTVCAAPEVTETPVSLASAGSR